MTLKTLKSAMNKDRPKRPLSPKLCDHSRTVIAVVTPELRDKARKLAADRGLSLSAWIRMQMEMGVRCG